MGRNIPVAVVENYIDGQIITLDWLIKQNSHNDLSNAFTI